MVAVVGDGNGPGDGLAHDVAVLISRLGNGHNGLEVSGRRQDAADVGLIEIGADGDCILTHGVVEGGCAVSGGQNGIAGIVGILIDDGGIKHHLIGDGVGGDTVADRGGKLAQIPTAVVGRGDAQQRDTIAHRIGDGAGVGFGSDDAACLRGQIHGQRTCGTGNDIGSAKQALKEAGVGVVGHSQLLGADGGEDGGEVVPILVVGAGASVATVIADGGGGGAVGITDGSGGGTVTEEDQTLIAHRNVGNGGIVQQVAAQYETCLHVGTAHVGVAEEVVGGQAVNGGLNGNHVVAAVDIDPVLHGIGIGVELHDGDQALIAALGVGNIAVEEALHRSLEDGQMVIGLHIVASGRAGDMSLMAVTAVGTALAAHLLALIGAAAAVGAVGTAALVVTVILVFAAVGADGLIHRVGYIQHQRDGAVGRARQLDGGVLGLYQQGDVEDVFAVGDGSSLRKVHLPIGGGGGRAVLMIVGVLKVLHHIGCGICKSGDTGEAHQHGQNHDQAENRLESLSCHYFVLLFLVLC